MEIEFKLSCTPQTAAALGPQLSRLTGAAPQRLLLKNVYYDTPRQDLRAQGIALRLRRQGKQLLQTVKCAGEVSGGLSSRPEWETPYTGRFDFSAVDDKKVRAQLETLARLPGYRATLDTDFSRHVWIWRPDADTCVEIVLDRGHIAAGGRTEPICELELELVSGEPHRLFDLVAHLGNLAPLFPAPLSKATRGSLLLDSPDKASTAVRPTIAGDSEQAFIALAQTCLDHVSINLPANCARFNAENVHQVRVGLRRLRALLELFRPALRKRWHRKAIEDGARAHMRALAPARNLEVLLAEIVAPVEAQIDTREWRRLHARIDALSKAAFAEARDYLLSHEFALWLLHASLALHTAPMRRKTREHTWIRTSKALAQKRLAAYGKRLRHAKPTPTSLHELRKAGKHLRYQLAATDLADPPAGKAAAKRLARLQDTLGQLNDLYGAAAIFERQPPSYASAIAAVGAAHQARHAELLEALPAQFKRLRDDLRALESDLEKTN